MKTISADEQEHQLYITVLGPSHVVIIRPCMALLYFICWSIFDDNEHNNHVLKFHNHFPVVLWKDSNSYTQRRGFKQAENSRAALIRETVCTWGGSTK